MGKIKKADNKEFAPVLVLQNFTQASTFSMGLLEIAACYFLEDNPVMTRAIRGIFAEMAVSFTKKAVSMHYPKLIKFKPHEGRLIYQCASAMGHIKQNFTSFINEIDQHLIV